MPGWQDVVPNGYNVDDAEVERTLHEVQPPQPPLEPVDHQPCVSTLHSILLHYYY